MKTLSTTIIALGLVSALAACTPKPTANTPAAPSPAPTPGADMAPMPAPTGTQATTASGTGTVTALDTTAGTITIDHQAIAQANWPAMVMAFKAAPAVVQGIKVGDQVDFELRLNGGTGEVTAIHKK